MRLKSNKNYISCFFIIAFLLLKVVNLHAFEHITEQEFDEEHCELCEFYTVNSNNNPITFPPESPQITVPFVFISEPVQVDYKSPYIATSFSWFYFNKPPPTL